MRKWSITLTIIILGIAIIIAFFNYKPLNNKSLNNQTYFLAKSYWKKGYPFLVPFPKGTTIKKVALTFFPSFENIFLKNSKTWILVKPTIKIYEDIIFKIEE